MSLGLHVAPKTPSKIKRRIAAGALSLAVLASAGIAAISAPTEAQAAAAGGSVCTASLVKTGPDSTPLAGAVFGASVEQRDEGAWVAAKQAALAADQSVKDAGAVAVAAEVARDAASQAGYEAAFTPAWEEARAAALAPWIEKNGSVAEAQEAQGSGNWASFRGSSQGSPEAWAENWGFAQETASGKADTKAAEVAEAVRAETLAQHQPAVDAAFAALSAVQATANAAAEAQADATVPWQRTQLEPKTTGADGVVAWTTTGLCDTFLAQEQVSPEGFVLDTAEQAFVWTGTDTTGAGTATMVNQPILEEPETPEVPPTEPENPVEPETPAPPVEPEPVVEKPVVEKPVVETPAPAPVSKRQVEVTAALR